jgi:hypothetical protein
MAPHYSVPRTPRLGLFASIRRLLLGDRAKRVQVSDHGALMRALGRAWATPMTLVFSSGALITLGQQQILELVGEWQQHRQLNFVTLALLAITFVIVGGMDLTLLNSAVELRDARLRGIDPRTDPHYRGATLRVWLVSAIESATFMNVAYQLDQPPAFSTHLWAAVVAWGFIAMRALVAPICAMYLATLGKRAIVRREMYANIMLTIGGTIQQILENLQFAADERLIEPLWRMQVLVDRASRARNDEEMDQFDNQLLAALERVRRLRDGFQEAASGAGGQQATFALAGVSAPEAELAGDGDTSGGDVTGATGASTAATPAAPAVKWTRERGDQIERWALGEVGANGSQP